jgi:hypothetical protein
MKIKESFVKLSHVERDQVSIYVARIVYMHYEKDVLMLIFCMLYCESRLKTLLNLHINVTTSHKIYVNRGN